MSNLASQIIQDTGLNVVVLTGGKNEEQEKAIVDFCTHEQIEDFVKFQISTEGLLCEYSKKHSE